MELKKYFKLKSFVKYRQILKKIKVYHQNFKINKTDFFKKIDYKFMKKKCLALSSNV